jgi:para-aminobenzoate synthetase / 4-amino-4-deoxychorismate lyase
VRAALETKVSGARDARLRVRLLLDEDGRVSVTTTAIAAPQPGATMGYVVSPTRLHSGEPFLQHKTTERQLYDREWQHFHDTAGADEVIYLNERDELAEGSRTSVFIERDGVLLTPPLTAGALPGVLRADLLASGRAIEARLTPADLIAPGAKVYLGNSVRGLVPAKPVGPSEVG